MIRKFSGWFPPEIELPLPIHKMVASLVPKNISSLDTGSEKHETCKTFNIYFRKNKRCIN